MTRPNTEPVHIGVILQRSLGRILARYNIKTEAQAAELRRWLDQDAELQKRSEEIKEALDEEENPERCNALIEEFAALKDRRDALGDECARRIDQAAGSAP